MAEVSVSVLHKGFSTLSADRALRRRILDSRNALAGSGAWGMSLVGVVETRKSFTRVRRRAHGLGTSRAVAIVRDEARRLAPVRRGNLKGSIQYRKGSRGWMVFTSKSKIVRGLKGKQRRVYASYVHQGVSSRGQAPQPFLTQARRNKHDEIMREMNSALIDVIEDERRKALRSQGWSSFMVRQGYRTLGGYGDTASFPLRTSSARVPAWRVN